MAGRGGARPGAGRRKRSLVGKTRRIAEQLAHEGVTPLEVMIHAMKTYLGDGDLPNAMGAARDAAPYIHPRLAAVAHIPANNNSLDTFSLNELSELRRALQAVEDEARGPLLELSADNNEPPADASPADAPLFD